MSSEIGNIAAGGAGVAGMRPRTSAPITPNPSASAPALADQAPKVIAPKPVAIQFDEGRARQNLQAAVSALNDQMAATKTGLGFSLDKALNQPVVTVRNTATGEVVRQIPTEVVVRLAHSIDAMKGLLLNATV